MPGTLRNQLKKCFERLFLPEGLPPSSKSWGPLGLVAPSHTSSSSSGLGSQHWGGVGGRVCS